MWKLRLLILGLVMSAMMLTGGFGHAASWLPMNQPMLDVDRSSDLVVPNLFRVRLIQPAPSEPETIQTETIQPGTDIEIQLRNIQDR